MTSLSTSTHLTIQTMMEYVWLFQQRCKAWKTRKWKNENLKIRRKKEFWRQSHIVYLLPRLWGKFLPQLHQWRNCPPVHFFLHGPWWNLCDHLCPLSLLKENNHVKQHHKIGRWMINNDQFILLYVFTAINIEKNKTFRPILGRSCRFIFNVGTWLWTSGQMCFIFRCNIISSQRRARWGLPGRVKKQDIQILIFGIKQESRTIFSNFPYQVKNQEFWQSKTLFKKKSRYFKIFFLVTSKKRETGFKILRKEISRIEIEFWQ